MSWHELDVGPSEPDWGQRHDGPRPTPEPEPDVTVHVAEPHPDPEPDPEPDWDHLRGDGEGPLEEIPTPLPHVRHNAAPRHRKVIQDPFPYEMPGGFIRRSRQRMGSHRGDLDTIELAAYYASPKWILVQRRKHNAHWLWR